MPEAQTVEAPETIIATNEPAPLTAPIPPELQALMERVLPIDSDKPPQEAAEAPSTKLQAPEKQQAPKEDETGKKAADPEKSTLRLAPDFTAPEKKEEPKAPVEPDVQITDEMIAAEKSPKKQADMRKFRDAFNSVKQENARLKEQPPQKTDDPGAQAVIDRQNQQIIELSGRLERLNVQAHPEFQRQFVQPRNQMFGQALEIVKAVGGDPDAFERTMALSGKNKIAALDDMLKDIDSPVMRDRLGRLIDGIDAKDQEISAALKDSKGLSENLTRQETIARHEMLQRQEQQLKGLLGAATRNLSEGIEMPEGGKMQLEVLQKTGNPEFKWFDDQADDIRATAEEILLKATPEKMAVASVLASACGAYRSMWQSERAARKASDARLAAIEGAEPNLADRGKPKPAPEGEFAPDADITQVALTRLKRGDFDQRK